MAVETERLSPAQHLAQRIAALDAEVERIRAEDGDPAEALGAYMRTRFGVAAVMESYEEYLRHEDSFLFDDYTDGIEEDDGGAPR